MTIKRKMLSLFLMVMLVIVTGTCAFAEKVDEGLTSFETTTEDTVGMDDITQDSLGNGVQPPILKSNRYYTTTVTERLGSCNIYVSKKEARNDATYETALKIGAAVGMSFIPSRIIGTLAGAAVSAFYTSPTHAAGKYSATSYMVKLVEKDRLTGKIRSVLSRSYKFNLSHKGKTKTFSFPYN